MNPPESIGTKKSTNIPCMMSQWHHKWRHVKNMKITKNRQNHGFSLFFQAKVAFFGNDVCQSMLTHVLTPNKPNKIKHSESVSWKQKTRFVCNFHWNSVFRWTKRSITQRRVTTLGPIFKKMVLNRAQGLKEKSHEVSTRKNNNRLRYNKKCWGGQIPHPPRLF